MYPNARATKLYQQHSLHNLPTGEQLARLYELSASHLERAAQCAQDHEYEARFQATDEALKISIALLEALDRDEHAKPITDVMDAVAAKVEALCMEGSIHNEADKFTQCAKMMRGMAQNWRVFQQRALEQGIKPEPASPEDSLKTEG